LILKTIFDLYIFQERNKSYNLQKCSFPFKINEKEIYAKLQKQKDVVYVITKLIKIHTEKNPGYDVICMYTYLGATARAFLIRFCLRRIFLAG